MSRPFAVSFSVHSYVSRAVMTRAGSKHAPALMVNSCSGKMGHATAEAVLRAGCQLVPYTLDISSEGSSIDVSGQAVQRVGPHERDEVCALPCRTEASCHVLAEVLMLRGLVDGHAC